MRYSFLLLLFVPGLLSAQETRKISFPNVTGYETMTVDLHMHTVFSDGSVWPDIRVYEAIEDGLDLIATTEHLEYQPHKEDIPHPNRNRSFEIASKIAERDNLLVINGAEITRDMPPGHSNAVFISDANALLQDNAMDAFREAGKQNAFTFWNHPNWTSQRPDGIATLTAMHQELISEGLLHGIEVVNENTYSEEALQIALDHNLTILGTSDIHGLVDWTFNIHQGGHRPVTLVFATDRTPEAVKEALFAGRTAAYFNDLLIGRETQMLPLLTASLEIVSAKRNENNTVVPVIIKNHSPVRFILENLSEYSLHAHADVVEIAAHGETTLEVKTVEARDQFTLKFRVLNAITAPGKNAEIQWIMNSE